MNFLETDLKIGPVIIGNAAVELVDNIPHQVISTLSSLKIGALQLVRDIRDELVFFEEVHHTGCQLFIFKIKLLQQFLFFQEGGLLLEVLVPDPAWPYSWCNFKRDAQRKVNNC